MNKLITIVLVFMLIIVSSCVKNEDNNKNADVNYNESDGENNNVSNDENNVSNDENNVSNDEHQRFRRIRSSGSNWAK